MNQPQLIDLSLCDDDVVYTPDWVAKDMVNFFKPSGSILEPCKGSGVFTNLMPTAEFCEIELGVDFFKCTKQFDYVFGNPPYSIFSKWMSHSMEIANNIIYLIPLNKVFNSGKFMNDFRKWGHPIHMRYYANGNALDFPFGFAIGAVHFKRGYFGAMDFSFYGDV